MLEVTSEAVKELESQNVLGKELTPGGFKAKVDPKA